MNCMIRIYRQNRYKTPGDIDLKGYALSDVSLKTGTAQSVTLFIYNETVQKK